MKPIMNPNDKCRSFWLIQVIPETALVVPAGNAVASEKNLRPPAVPPVASRS